MAHKESASGLEYETLYLDIALKFYDTQRLRAKSDAEGVLMGVQISNGVIAVFGVLVTFQGFEKWGIVSTLLASIAGGLTAWEAHYRHKDLYVERTEILSALQELKAKAGYQIATDENPAKVAVLISEGIAALRALDMTKWSTLRDGSLSPAQPSEAAKESGAQTTT